MNVIGSSEDWKGEHLIRMVPRAAREAAAQTIADRDAGGLLISIQAIVDLAKQGLSLSRIADALKCSRPHICTLAKRHGIIMPDGRANKQGARK